jgi:hypothetical protein
MSPYDDWTDSEDPVYITEADYAELAEVARNCITLIEPEP